MWRELLSDILIFLSALWQHASGFVTCAGVGVVTLIVEHFTKWRIPRRLVSTVVLGALLLACFLAWRDMYSRSEASGKQVADLKEQVAKSEGKRETLEAQRDAAYQQRDAAYQQRDTKQSETDFLRDQVLKKLAEQPPSLRVLSPGPLPPVIGGKVEVVRQENVRPSAPGGKYALETTLRAKVDLDPAWFWVKCDGPIDDTSCHFMDGSPISALHRYYSADRKTVWIHFESPAFTVERSLKVLLTGPTAFRAVRTDEGRPPAGAKEDVRTGLQIVL